MAGTYLVLSLAFHSTLAISQSPHLWTFNFSKLSIILALSLSIFFFISPWFRMGISTMRLAITHYHFPIRLSVALVDSSSNSSEVVRIMALMNTRRWLSSAVWAAPSCGSLNTPVSTSSSINCEFWRSLGSVKMAGPSRLIAAARIFFNETNGATGSFKIGRAV